MLSRLTYSIFLLAGIALAQSQPGQRNDDPQSDIRVNVRLVNVFATVTDANGAPVVDLNRDDFSIQEDGHPEKISIFEQQSGVPVSIVLALDVSGSVRKDQQLEIESARRFISSVLRKEDALSVMTFSTYVNEVVRFTNDWRAIVDGMRNIHSGGGTSLYDAIYLGSQRLARRDGRKVMVIITDGGDTTSQVNYQEAVRQAIESETMVYSIIIVPVGSDAGRNLGGEHALIQISADTGGKYYYAESTSNLDTAFQQISKELRTQYLLAYYPSRKTAKDDFRAIKVKIMRAAGNTAPAEPVSPVDAANGSAPSEIKHPGPYKVRYRSGYYTSKPE